MHRFNLLNRSHRLNTFVCAMPLAEKAPGAAAAVSGEHPGPISHFGDAWCSLCAFHLRGHRASRGSAKPQTTRRRRSITAARSRAGLCLTNCGNRQLNTESVAKGRQRARGVASQNRSTDDFPEFLGFVRVAGRFQDLFQTLQRPKIRPFLALWLGANASRRQT